METDRSTCIDHTRVVSKRRALHPVRCTVCHGTDCVPKDRSLVDQGFPPAPTVPSPISSRLALTMLQAKEPYEYDAFMRMRPTVSASATDANSLHIEWQRAKLLRALPLMPGAANTGDLQLLHDESDDCNSLSSDVRPGELENGAFLSVLSALASEPERIRRLIQPSTGTFAYNR